MSDRVIFQRGTGKPCCPNHGCPLEGLPFPMNSKGVGMCPVSGAHFTYEAEVNENKMVKDINGNLKPEKQWKLIGND